MLYFLMSKLLTPKGKNIKFEIHNTFMLDLFSRFAKHHFIIYLTLSTMAGVKSMMSINCIS